MAEGIHSCGGQERQGHFAMADRAVQGRPVDTPIRGKTLQGWNRIWLGTPQGPELDGE